MTASPGRKARPDAAKRSESADRPLAALGQVERSRHIAVGAAVRERGGAGARERGWPGGTTTLPTPGLGRGVAAQTTSQTAESANPSLGRGVGRVRVPDPVRSRCPMSPPPRVTPRAAWQRGGRAHPDRDLRGRPDHAHAIPARGRLCPHARRRIGHAADDRDHPDKALLGPPARSALERDARLERPRRQRRIPATSASQLPAAIRSWSARSRPVHSRKCSTPPSGAGRYG